MVKGGPHRRVSEAAAAQLLEQERPELRLPQRCKADPGRAILPGSTCC